MGGRELRNAVGALNRGIPVRTCSGAPAGGMRCFCGDRMSVRAGYPAPGNNEAGKWNPHFPASLLPGAVAS